MLGDGEGIDERSGCCCWVWVSVRGSESCGGRGRESGSVDKSFEDGGDGFDGGELELVVGLRRGKEGVEVSFDVQENELKGVRLTSVRSI